MESKLSSDEVSDDCVFKQTSLVKARDNLSSKVKVPGAILSLGSTPLYHSGKADF